MSLVGRGISIYRNDGIVELMRAAKRYYYYDLDAIRKTGKSIREKNLAGFVSYSTRAILRKDIYMWYQQRKKQNPLLINTDVGKMFVDLYDKGLSRELFIWRSREEYSNTIFKRELNKIAENKDDNVKILEIGANIGYFILSEVDSLGDQVEIIAFEPSDKNFEILKKNIVYNELDQLVSAHHAAVGANSRMVEFEMAEKYNQSRVKNENLKTDDSEILDVMDVQQISIDSFLENQKILPEDIDVIRMDIQGFEFEAFKGMMDLLDRKSELLVFIETHPNLISDDQHEFVIKTLQDAGFKPISSSKISDLNSLNHEKLYDEPMELIVKRPK